MKSKRFNRIMIFKSGQPDSLSTDLGVGTFWGFSIGERKNNEYIYSLYQDNFWGQCNILASEYHSEIKLMLDLLGKAQFINILDKNIEEINKKSPLPPATSYYFLLKNRRKKIIEWNSLSCLIDTLDSGVLHDLIEVINSVIYQRKTTDKLSKYLDKSIYETIHPKQI